MSRQQWLDLPDPLSWLGSFPYRTSDRGVWLFACACCRTIPEIRASEDAGAALADAEACASGQFERTELLDRWRSSLPALGEGEADEALLRAMFPWQSGGGLQGAAARVAAIARWRVARAAKKQPGRRAERRAVAFYRKEVRKQQGHLLRCLMPSPFQPFEVNIPRQVREDPLVTRIARAIYSDNLFADLPVLADALEDAGCQNAEVLAHCRGPRHHARGCWVVDRLIFDKLTTS